ncbi:MAG: isocitrate/isopropylmalate family dehydrogenase [Gemmatimonadales bacterium]
MTTPITLITGDGIGPQISEAALRVLAAAGARVEWDHQLAGMAAIERGYGPLPDETFDSTCANKVALKGPLSTPVGEGFRSITSRCARCSISTRTCGRRRP